MFSLDQYEINKIIACMKSKCLNLTSKNSYEVVFMHFLCNYAMVSEAFAKI